MSLVPDTHVRGHRLVASRIALLLILALSAFIQFTVVARTEVEAPFRADSREYFFSAYNLDHYGVYSSTVTWPPEKHLQPPASDSARTPGYPLFLLLVGHPQPNLDFLQRVTFTQAALGVLSVWLMYLIAARFMGRRWACIAALLTAISPHLAVSSTYVLTETLFFFLLLASILGLLLAIDSPRRWPYLLVGLLWGLCSLVRPTVIFVPVLAMIAVVVIPRLKNLRAGVLLMFLGFALAMSPWFIRNHGLPPQPATSGKMVPFLLAGAYPNFTYNDDPATYGFGYSKDPHAAENGRSLSSTLSYIASCFRQHPLTYARWYLIGKPGYFLSWTNFKGAGDVFVYSVASSPYLDDRRFDMIHRLAYALHWPLMFLGVAGAILPWWRAGQMGLAGDQLVAARVVSLVVLYAIGFHMVGAPFPRYGVPFRPLLYPLALLAMLMAWRSRTHWVRHSD